MTNTVRWVGFLRSLRSPFVADVGDVVALSDDAFAALKTGLKGGSTYLCDLTPITIAVSLSRNGIEVPTAVSTVATMRCPSCYTGDGVSVCRVCGGRRRVVIPHKLGAMR
jgi:hypothetical protein